ncbi:MAG TPA: transaldolase, partial [Armatimonadota bacterium]|nr:transaldolase [Armatimonadota bacterium]
TSPRLASFGDWAEQLLAESTGKQDTDGKHVGLVPVVDEPAGEARAYGDDRVFASLVLGDDNAHGRLTDELIAAGQPVARTLVADAASIGAEMFRWEFATAVAGALMRIDPFDQPDVQAAKDKTRDVLAEFAKAGSLPQSPPDATGEGLSAWAMPQGIAGARSVADAVSRLLGQVQTGDYFALMAYLPRSAATDDMLGQMRARVRDALGVATTLGYGPRFLHSTGQLHKGGPNTGVFLQITESGDEKLEIPGEDYDFATLKDAQAAGDFEVLRDLGRRVLRVDVGADVEGGLQRLLAMVEGALAG